MAHIPYGYRIEGGKAVPDEVQAEKLNAFFEFYLSGLSLKNAWHLAGVELTVSCLRDYMDTGTYAGTDYYPPIVPGGTQEKLMEERERRTHPGSSKFVPPLPVQTEFRLKEAIGKEAGSAAERATHRYSLIEPVTADAAEKGEAWQ